MSVFSGKNFTDCLWSSQKCRTNIHDCFNMLGTPSKAAAAAHRRRCFHPLHEMQEVQNPHRMRHHHHFIPSICCIHYLYFTLQSAQGSVSNLRDFSTQLWQTQRSVECYIFDCKLKKRMFWVTYLCILEGDPPIICSHV